jgi:hypothetical protein
MQSNIFETTWNIYASTWSIQNEQQRLHTLQTCVTDNCVYTDPVIRVEGLHHLSGYMAEIQKNIPCVVFKKKWFNSHNHTSLVHWDMQDGHGNSITEGSSYIVYGANGVIQEMNGFFVPPAPAAA